MLSLWLRIEIPASTWIGILSAFIALLSLYYAVYSVKGARKANLTNLLQAQMSARAETANNIIMHTVHNVFPKLDHHASTIVSAIITAEEVLNSHQKEKPAINSRLIRSIAWDDQDDQILIDQFYLQLHTSIRQFLSRDITYSQYRNGGKEMSNPHEVAVTINQQLERCREFLKESIRRNDEGEFEKLHQISIERNQRLSRHS